MHVRDNKYHILNQRFRLSCMTWYFKVNLKDRADGNPLTKITGWDFRLEICITPTRQSLLAEHSGNEIVLRLQMKLKMNPSSSILMSNSSIVFNTNRHLRGNIKFIKFLIQGLKLHQIIKYLVLKPTPNICCWCNTLPMTNRILLPMKQNLTSRW